MGRIVNKLICIGFILISCKSQETISQKNEDLYKIIETKEYKDNALYYKTIPYESISFGRPLSYEGINEYNYEINWVAENNRFVNFDTIFNENQQEQINEKFRSLKEVKLKTSELKAPQILSKIQNNKRGYASVSFPFVQEAIDGTLYAFILRSWYRNHSGESILIIYKLSDGKWKEFAKVPFGIT